MQQKEKYRGVNCSKCGQFVGKDGRVDIMYDGYNGGYEMGYCYCARCLKHIQVKNPHLDAAQKALRNISDILIGS